MSVIGALSASQAAVDADCQDHHESPGAAYAMQVEAANDFEVSLPVSILWGGLDRQIEHHLFPSMPTPNLRRARPIVRAYCAELGVPYHETGLVASYREAVRHLHRVGAPIRASHRR